MRGLRFAYLEDAWDTLVSLGYRKVGRRSWVDRAGRWIVVDPGVTGVLATRR